MTAADGSLLIVSLISGSSPFTFSLKGIKVGWAIFFGIAKFLLVNDKTGLV